MIGNKMKKILICIFLLFIFTAMLGLGTWQVQRLTWKNDIIQNLENVYAQDSAQKNFEFNDLIIKNEDIPVLYGRVRGLFDYSKEILVGPRPYNGEIGYYVITPLKLNEGYVFVHRGFLKIEHKERLSETHSKGPVSASGLLRKPDWNKFTPDNSPENNIWTKLDLDNIAGAQNISPYAPLLLYAEDTYPASDILQLQQERWLPRNKHQQYAIFWFGMAFVFAILIGFYVRSSRTAK